MSRHYEKVFFLLFLRATAAAADGISFNELPAIQIKGIDHPVQVFEMPSTPDMER